MKTVFTMIKPGIGLLALVLAMTGCATAPFSQQPSSRKPAAKAPVVDRSARRPPGYPAPQPAPPLDVGQLPEEDSLLPREYASTPSSDPYAKPNGYGPPARPYPVVPNDNYRQPAYPPSGAVSQSPTYPTSTSNNYQQPTYPPGAAAPYPAQAPGSMPEPQPVVPRTPRAAPAPAPAEPAVALAPPPSVTPEPEPEPEPIQPPARPPAQPAEPPADLPPAEITREGNQAVAALLESADKYVKSKQLDKAGAALERALRIEPRNAGIWHDLAQIRLHQGQYQQAESLASKSINLAGGNRGLQSRNWKVIAVARKATGNRAGAEEAEAQASQLSR